jgi:hypothetical protein
VEGSSWLAIDLDFVACVGAVDWAFYDESWGPTEALLQVPALHTDAQ